MSQAMVAKQSLSDFPEVAVAEKKCTELRELLRLREGELKKAELDFPSDVGHEAARLLSGDITGPDIGGLRHSVEVSRRALEMAEQNWRQACLRAGSQLCEENRAEHFELSARIRDAVAELADSLVEENQFVQRFAAMGISPDFARPYLEIHRDLLDEFRLVSPDEFRPLT